MCLNPKWIYKKGRYKQDNYRGSAGDFYELGTFSKCGQCEQCINEKSNNWVVRNYYEEKAHTRKSFITLTYENSPVILVKKDFQDFMKRFRTKLDRTTGEKVRMFLAGEYGERHNRPHAHIIIYGWEDENKKYMDINRKGNILYKSDTVQECWGLGRTSYQNFNENEIPYLSLYNTANEEFKKAYKLNHDKVKTLENYAKNHIRNEAQYKNLILQLKDYKNELEKEKKEYLAIKEFNTWSKALGWEEFEKQYKNSSVYAFEEYVANGYTFATPSPWVKKLANQGDIQAAQEMFRRENDLIKETNEHRERIKNLLEVQAKKKQEILDYRTKKTEIAIL